MKRVCLFKGITVLILVISLNGLTAQDAWAGRKDKHGRGRYQPYPRHHPYYGRRVSLPEMIAKAIIVSSREYHYYHGTFYKKTRHGYFVVDAPLDARVRVLPLGSKRVLINGKRYYHYNGVYFVKKPLGYYVVEDPVYEVVELPYSVRFQEESAWKGSPKKQRSLDDEYIVNILNVQGNYTPVKIIAADNGYIGPQGEYYPEFPSVAQLKVMYGR